MDDIVQKIQKNILDPNIKLNFILLTAKVLAHQLHNSEFTNWVNSELNGYDSPDNLPDYRKFTPRSTGTFTDGYSIVRNKVIPVSLIHDEWLRKHVTKYHIFDGIRSVDELANRSEKTLKLPWPDEFVHFFNHEQLMNAHCVEAAFVVNPHHFAQILDTVRNRLLDFVLEINDLDWRFGESPLPETQIQHLVEVKIFNNPDGGTMSVFDQRGQNVNYQYNAAGNINIEAVQNQIELIEQLANLQLEIGKAKSAGVIDEDAAIDAEYQIQKAIQVAKKAEPDKTTFLDHIGKAKDLLEDITAATGLVTALIKAAELAKNLL